MVQLEFPLTRSLKRMGFSKKYESNRYMKITSHSLRAFFFTRASRKHVDNYAHKITEYGGYLIQYDRMTEDEWLDMYMNLEPAQTDTC